MTLTYVRLTPEMAPSEFQVCRGCTSVHHKREIICPTCAHYHWDDDRDLVLSQSAKINAPGYVRQTPEYDF